mmetsp:Transcript_49630/g.153276  ORF Transcript_49630/g.153276 Transcript_49630/m.153276 type:complete len:200 (+) Transcript_49630:2571-3170(+)
MTTTAAPYRRIRRACSMNSASPFLSEMELTMALPCVHLRPASTTWNLDESIMKGTRETSGSEATRLTKRVMAATPSMRPSSMLKSRMTAPSSTCLRAMASPASKSLFLMSFLKAREPERLQRSPTFMKPSSLVTCSASRPDSIMVLCLVPLGRGVMPLTASAMARMWSGEEPQQPPTMFTQPAAAKPRIASAISAGVRS